MPDVRKLFGTSFTRDDTSSATYLLAQLGTSIINVDTGLGYPININKDFNLYSGSLPTEDSSFVFFLDRIFHFNGRGPNLSLNVQDSSAVWNRDNVWPTPLAKHAAVYANRIFIGNCRIPINENPDPFGQSDTVFLTYNPVFKNRIFYSDFPQQKYLTWGFGKGLIASANAGAVRVTVPQAQREGSYFISNNIKEGDPIFIHHSGVSSNPWRQYTVKVVESEYAIQLATPLVANTVNTYWVGGNWFDVDPGDNDEIMGLQEDGNNLVIFKNFTTHRYNDSSLVKIQNIGTTSSKSLVNVDGAIFFFHGSDGERTGIYLYDRSEVSKLSKRIQPFIDAMNTSNYDKVVGWREGSLVRMFLGNLSNQNASNRAFNISLTNAVATLDLATNTWTVDPIGDVIRSAGEIFESQTRKVMLGNDSNEVLHTPSGYSFNGDPIPFRVGKGPVYPRGSEISNVFTRVQVISRDAGNVKVSYKLWNTPFDVEDKWVELGPLRRDKVELTIPRKYSQGSGIDFRFSEISTSENNFVIEKVSVYSYPDRNTYPEIRQLP